MSAKAFWAGVGIVVGIGLAAAGWVVGEAAAEETDKPIRSLRTWEVARRDCRTSISRQEVTLFANGTLRLRLTGPDLDDLRLAELTPDEVEAFINRLTAEDLSEVPASRDEVLGDWVERCGLYLELPDREPERYFFARFDSLPLALSRINAVVNDMLAQVENQAPEGGLPPNYHPEPGDVLERSDGQQFRVIALTSDRRGVELSGLDEPLTIYIAIDEVRRQFVSLVNREPFP